MGYYKSEHKTVKRGSFANGGSVSQDMGEYFPGGVMDTMIRKKAAMDASDPQQNKGQGPTKARARDSQ